MPNALVPNQINYLNEQLQREGAQSRADKLAESNLRLQGAQLGQQEKNALFQNAMVLENMRRQRWLDEEVTGLQAVLTNPNMTPGQRVNFIQSIAKQIGPEEANNLLNGIVAKRSNWAQAVQKGVSDYRKFMMDQNKLSGEARNLEILKGGKPSLGEYKQFRQQLREDPGALDDFTPEEIDLMGATYNLKGTLPAMGRGRQATKLRAAVLKSAARQALGTGSGASDIIASQADVKAIGGSIAQQEKQFGSMGSFVKNLDAQVNKVKELAKDLKTFDTRLLNIPLRAVRGKIKGSPEQAKYDMYLTEIESEIGKLATGATGSVAELSQGAQEKWSKIHDKNLSIQDMIALLEETSQAGKIRMKSVEDQLKETRTRLKNVGKPQKDLTSMSDEELLKAIGE